MKKCIFLLIAILALALSVVIVLFIQLRKQQGLIATLFTPELQKASDSFYSEYLSDTPNVANYSIKVLNIKRNDKGYYIKFGIQPYLGPHYPVGYDEAKYFVDNIGTITLLNYTHLKNYEIPSRLGVTIRTPIPTS